MLTFEGWGNAEVIAANSITVDGDATTHKAITMTASGDYRTPVKVQITAAITTVGEKDVIVTGDQAGSVTFADYWTVTEGAGYVDIYTYGDLTDKELVKSSMDVAIKTALSIYNGYMNGHVDNIPHTIGEYPEVASMIISQIAVSYLWTVKGPAEEYRTRAEMWWDMSQKLIMQIRDRKLGLIFPDGTFATYPDSMSYDRVYHTGSFGVLDIYSEEVFNR